VDLSAFYLDVLKDRLYTGRRDGVERRASQTVFYELMRALTGMMAPILSFLAEEAYGYLPGQKLESVFLEKFPKENPAWEKAGLLEDFSAVVAVRTETQKLLEDLRRNKEIGSSLEAAAVLPLDAKDAAQRSVIAKYSDDFWREILIVSSATKAKANEVGVQKATGEKCERCWNYTHKLGADSRFPGVCPKCTEALA
jgi:isoleucyl-tRNA synthetase